MNTLRLVISDWLTAFQRNLVVVGINTSVARGCEMYISLSSPKDWIPRNNTAPVWSHSVINQTLVSKKWPCCCDVVTTSTVVRWMQGYVIIL